MNSFLNFKKFEVYARTKEEAFEQANFRVIGDATSAFRRWQNSTINITSANIKQWMMEFLARNTKNYPGLGYYITIDPPVESTRENPFVFNNKNNNIGRRKYARAFQIISVEDNKILGESFGSKQSAIDLAKEIFKKGFRGKMICKFTKQVVDGENLAFEAKYQPSKNSHPGTWILFGVERG